MFDAIFSWTTLWYVLLVLYVPACLGLVIIVLLQKGKGAGFAGSFGAGAGPGSETVFGPRAGQTLPVRLTYVAAVIFVLISLGMSLIAGRVGKGKAPELLENAGTTPGVTSELQDLGLGTGQPGAAAESQSPSGAEQQAAPATETAPAETPSPDAAAPSEE